ASHVRSATGLQLNTFNLDRAQYSLAVHFLPNAKPRQFLCCSITNAHAAVFKNHLICRALRAFQNFFRRLLPAHVDRANFHPQMKRNRGQIKMLLKHGRQHVLARVLLLEVPLRSTGTPAGAFSCHSSPHTCNAFCHASEYLYPVPVLNKTTVSCGLIQPEVASLRAAITVAAPSGAANTPSSDASSLPA